MTEMSGAPVKVTRARLIIEFADGSARHFEARDPTEAEIKLLTVDDWMEQRYGYRADPPFFPADYLHRLLPSFGDRFGGVILRLACNPNGLEPAAHLRIEEESGEIPPELAARVLELIESSWMPHEPLTEIKPYLARIAGRLA